MTDDIDPIERDEPTAENGGRPGGNHGDSVSEELRRLDALNEGIRDVTRVLAGVTTRDGIEDALDGLTRTGLYDEVAFLGTIDQWRLPVDGPGADDLPSDADREALAWRNRTGVPTPLEQFAEVPDVGRGSWALIPVCHGGSPYGHLVLATARPRAFSDRELAILERFGGTLGQVIDAVEDRRLLRSDAVTELTIECSEDALATVARNADCRLSLDGLVPADDVLAYFRVSGADARRTVDAATGVDGVGTARAIDDGTVELALAGGSAVVPLARGGTNLRTVEAGGETAEVVVEVVPATDVRALFDRVREHAPDARLTAKRDRNRSPSTERLGSDRPEGPLDGLTDRQREVVEAAYRAGYFEWPRDRTAQEVAESIGISSPTLHKHLRKAEKSVLSTLFETREGRPSKALD